MLLEFAISTVHITGGYEGCEQNEKLILVKSLTFPKKQPTI